MTKWSVELDRMNAKIQGDLSARLLTTMGDAADEAKRATVEAV